MKDLYQTKDGKIFDNRDAAQTHANNRARFEAEMDQLRASASEAYGRVLDKAYQYFNQGDYKNAISTITNILSEPGGLEGNEWLLTKRGMAFQFLGDYDRAIADYTNAIASYNGEKLFTFPYIMRAESYMFKKNYDKAIADCDIAIKLGGEDIGLSYYVKAIIYGEKGDREQHFIELKKSAEYGFEEAKKLIDKKNNNDKVLSLMKSALSFLKTDIDKAFADANKAVELGGDYIDQAFQTRGMVYIVLKKYDLAMADLKTAVNYGNTSALETIKQLEDMNTPDNEKQSASAVTEIKKVTYDNGVIYEGEFVNDNMHGKGKYTFINGNIYEGEFVNNKMHGKGKYTYVNGSTEEGEFENGEFVRGKYTFDNGAIYEGEVVNNKMHGKGKYTYADGDYEEGNFVDSKLNGKGKKISGDDGEDIEEGDFVNGKLHGYGKRIYYGEVYEGGFREDDYHGKGKLTDEDGNVYEGDFIEGSKHGIGKMTYADGKVEEGKWEDDEFVGK